MDLSKYLTFIELGVAGVAVIAVLAFGYHWGAGDVQGKWDKEKAETIAAQFTKEQADERAAAIVGNNVNTKLGALQSATLNQPQEIADATKHNGACAVQRLSPDSVQVYKRAASGR